MRWSKEWENFVYIPHGTFPENTFRLPPSAGTPLSAVFCAVSFHCNTCRQLGAGVPGGTSRRGDPGVRPEGDAVGSPKSPAKPSRQRTLSARPQTSGVIVRLPCLNRARNGQVLDVSGRNVLERSPVP